MKTNSSILKAFCRKLVMLLMLAVSASVAFAISGDGKTKNTNPASKSLLSIKPSIAPGSFSLRSGYNFRGSQVIGKGESRYISMNTLATYQSGHTTYIVPLKKKVLLNDKIVFNPNAATRR